MQYAQGFLAFLPTLVVSRIHQSSFLLAVADDKAETIQCQGNIFVFQSITVQGNGMTIFAEARGELVHDAAVHPHKIILGMLRHLDQFQGGEMIVG